jgi:hypothetical protein
MRYLLAVLLGMAVALSTIVPLAAARHEATSTTPQELSAYFVAVTKARAPVANFKATNNIAKIMRTLSGLQDRVAIRTAAVVAPAELKSAHGKLVKGWQLQSDLSHRLGTNGANFSDPEVAALAKKSTQMFRDYRVAALGLAARAGITAPSWIKKLGR